jgi:anti-sigma regulatory factor (Ser/Thr protein kinase)
VVAVHDSCSSSRGFLPPRRDGLLEAELPEPPADRYQFRFGRADLYDVRRLVLDHAVRMLPDQRAQELVLAASELATNSVLHGGGGGTVTMWSDEDSLFCEIRDAGRIEDPLIGRERPGTGRSSGRGLWIVNQLCDLVQLRALPLGNVARVQMRFS